MQALANLMQQVAAVAAPYDAQIRALDIAKADATAALTFQIETLKALLRPLILAEGRTVQVDGLKAIYHHKQTWDSEGLRTFATEVPAVLQCLKDASYVSFR